MTDRERIGAVYKVLHSECSGYGYRTPEHLSEKLKAWKIELSPEEVLTELEWLRSINAAETTMRVWKPSRWQ
jgi:hypothetical protein